MLAVPGTSNLEEQLENVYAENVKSIVKDDIPDQLSSVKIESSTTSYK